jgi:hypothetical protein
MHPRLPAGKPVSIDAHSYFKNGIPGNANESAPCVRFLEDIDTGTLMRAVFELRSRRNVPGKVFDRDDGVKNLVKVRRVFCVSSEDHHFVAP